MSLRLAELRSVIVVAQQGSLGRAAEALNITQPALSRRVADVEALLGVTLFERLPRGMRPTDAGLAFLRHAEVAVASIEDALEAAKEVKGQGTSEIAIGFIDVLCDDRLTGPCRRIRDRGRDVSIQFRSRVTSDQVSEDVLSGRVKLGLRYRDDTNPRLETQWLRDDAIIVACAADHKFAGTRSATVEQLTREQWLGYPVPTGALGESFNETLGLRGLSGWKTMAQDSFHAQLRLLEEGMGIALLPRHSVLEQLRSGRIVEVSTPLPVDVPVYLVWRRGSHLGGLGEALRNEIFAV